ncbi:alpha/beta fold hydrolase [Muricauda sp. 40Bstr401]|uniref:Alpha/beta fold hydrolase n=1 Tax=Flagellimonas sediminis TaxID=2696468 RepID=A0A6I5KRY2_9FLAO|nr:alpha/beta fold hydrolase [Allomuricauda sediminis]
MLLLFILTGFYLGYSQSEEKAITLETVSGKIEGSLLIPPTPENPPVVLIIAGSGPTDRDGNNPIMKNNSLKMLAEGLAEKGIASLRYDKRGIGESKVAGLEESQLRFEHYVDDAKAWVALLAGEPKFSKIIVLGHSEGSLIGMITSQNKDVAKYISVAGVADPAAKTLKEQLKAQPPFVLELSNPILDQLEMGKQVDSVPPTLYSLFRPSVQPYMISWFQYDPKTELAKLQIPILIVQGTTDIQVDVANANALSKANQKAKLEIIEGMNHILKPAPADRTANIATYGMPELPLIDGLLERIASFIK